MNAQLYKTGNKIYRVYVEIETLNSGDITFKETTTLTFNDDWDMNHFLKMYGYAFEIQRCEGTKELPNIDVKYLNEDGLSYVKHMISTVLEGSLRGGGMVVKLITKVPICSVEEIL